MSIQKFSQLGLTGIKQDFWGTDPKPSPPPANLTVWYEISSSDIAPVMANADNTGFPSTSFVDVGTSFTAAQYRGVVLHPNGNIYCAPRNSGSGMLEIDPVAETSQTRNPGVLSTMTSSSGAYFHSAVLTQSGNILCIPFNYDNFVEFDPVADTAIEYDCGLTLTGTVKFSGAVLLDSGNVVCSPQNFGQIVEMSPTAQTATASNYGLTLGTSALWGCARTWLKPDLVYMGPLRQGGVVVYDSANVTASQQTYGLSWNTGVNQYYGIAADKDGSLVLLNGTLGSTRVIDPVAETASSTSTSQQARGSQMGADGNVHAMPVSTSSYWFWDSDGNSVQTLAGSPSETYFGGTVTLSGDIICIPDTVDTNVLKITVPGTIDDDVNSANIILSPYINRGVI